MVDADTQQTVGIAQYPDSDMDMISRQSGWAEQQPEVWWQDLSFATRKLLHENKIDPADIKGIGIAYQMHGLVLIDQDHRVLRPSIIWCDSRAVAIGKAAFMDIGKEECLRRFLNSPGNFTASKLKWVKDNEPAVYSRVSKMLLPGDFIAMKLTGEAATTISGLSEGILWDFEEKKIASKVLDYYEIGEELLPDIVPTFSVQGKVTKEAAEMTGLIEGTPVTYRAGDQPNNALSLNVLDPGEIAATSGTSGVVYGIVNRPLYDPKSRVNAFAHVNYQENYDRIGILLCLNGAGIQYSWMKHQVALSGRSYTDMERMASSVPVGSDGLCILPFGNGSERMLEDKKLNSHIFNLEFNRHTRGHLYRAALEGVAFSFVHGVNLLKEMGLNVDVMRVGNDNMFQSEVFSQTIATLLDSHIEVVDTTGAVGAALAAGIAPGIYSDVKESVRGIRPNVVHEPGLNRTMCSQAYNYWESCLHKTVDESPSYGRMSDVLKSRNEMLQTEMDQKNKEIASATMNLMSKNDLLMEIKNTIHSIHPKLNGEPQKKEIARLLLQIDDSVSSERDWESFEEHFDFMHSNIFKKLKEVIPNITLSELKLCALLKMKLTTKEIADKLYMSVRGVETRRYRLRKKLNLDRDLALENFLDEL